MPLDEESRGTLAVIGAVLILGVNIYLLKIGTTLTPRLVLLSVAFVVGGVLLLVINVVLRLKFIFLETSFLLKILWMGIVSIALPWTMVSYALGSSAISNSFLLQMEVFYSLILSRIFLEEKVVGKHVVLALLSFVGVGLVLTDGAMKMIVLADLLFLLTPLFFQLGHVVAKQMLNEVDAKVIVMYRFLIGGITMLIISVLFGGNPVGISGISGWVVLASCIGFGYSISSSLFYYSIKHINLSKATSILIAYPLVSTVLAIIALGETLSVLKVVGIALVFASTVSLARVRPHASAQNRAI